MVGNSGEFEIVRETSDPVAPDPYLVAVDDGMLSRAAKVSSGRLR